MREPSEEGSKRIFTRDCPINARKGTAAMDVSNEGKAKQRKGSIWLCRVNRGPSALDNKRHAMSHMELTDHCFSSFSLIFLTYPSSLVIQSIDSSQTTPGYFSQYFCDFLSVYRSPGSW
jgi:hypothetical protein